jgi:hypothetical protein
MSKNKKYICESCDFKTDYKTRYDEHILTIKHYKLSQWKSEGNQNNQNHQTLSNFICQYCNKSYVTSSGLWKHNKKCNSSQTTQTLQTIMNELVDIKKQNAELKQLFEQNQIIVANANQTQNDKPQQITNIHGNQNNNTYNNTMVFLNTECKNAVNMKQFLDNISIDINELDFIIKDNKRVTSITNLFLKHLNKYSLYERPIHCTDIKRLSVYVKDNNTWLSKEQGTAKLTQSIHDITKIAIKTIPEWENHNKPIMDPEHLKDDMLKVFQILNAPIKDNENQKIMKTIASNIKLGEGTYVASYTLRLNL